MSIRSSLAITRRQFLKLAGLTGAVGLGGLGWTASMYQTPLTRDLVVTSYNLKTAKWTHAKPLTIAFVTDFHVGCSSVDLDVLQRIVDQTNALGADVIMLGGDYQIRHTQFRSRRHLYVPAAPIAERLGRLHAPLGVYGVMGNHDWGSDGTDLWDALVAQHIVMLENDAVRIGQDDDGFWLIGLADYSTRISDYGRAAGMIKDNAPRLVLSHDPITFARAENDIVVQLSGHTHGGQVVLPLVGPVVKATPDTPMAWSYGLVEHERRQMIVSSGIGTSIMPLKNTPNEIVHLTIHGIDA